MGTITGRVEKFNTKNGRYSVLMDDQNWYGLGYNDPRKSWDDPTLPLDGANVQFDFTSNDSKGKTYYNVTEGTFRTQMSTVGKTPPPAAKKAWGGNKADPAKDEYWKNKEANDANMQKRISFNAATNSAIALVTAGVANGLLPLTGKGDAKYVAFTEMVATETDFLYRKFMNAADNHDEIMGKTTATDSAPEAEVETAPEPEPQEETPAADDDGWS
jgi:hypothetical protein